MKKVASMFLFVVLLMFSLPPNVDPLVIYDESISGDLSFANLASTAFTLNLGSNEIIGTITGPQDVFDPFAFTVSYELQLDEITLVTFEGSSAAFTMFDGPSAELPDIGGLVVKPFHAGLDLLSLMDIEGVPPLPARTYSARWFTAGERPQSYHIDLRVNPVPEPATMLLLGSGLAGLAGYGRKRFKK